MLQISIVALFKMDNIAAVGVIYMGVRFCSLLEESRFRLLIKSAVEICIRHDGLSDFSPGLYLIYRCLGFALLWTVKHQTNIYI